MKTKHLAVPSAASSPINADPIRELFDIRPEADILGMNVLRIAGKLKIRVIYQENEKFNVATCGFNKVIGDNVTARVETFSCNWKGDAL